METAIVSIVCIALIFVGGMTMSQNYLSSVDSTSQQFQHVLSRDQAILKTSITPLSANVSGENTIYISLRNTGQAKLADWEHWDIIVQYYNGVLMHASWLPYVAANPVGNAWTVDAICIDAAQGTPEVFEPGILNPGEEMIIKATVAPAIGRPTNDQVVISTPNGVSAYLPFSRG